MKNKINKLNRLIFKIEQLTIFAYDNTWILSQKTLPLIIFIKNIFKLKILKNYVRASLIMQLKD